MQTTTLGQLVADLFDRYERRFHDKELAAVATQATITDMLLESRCRRQVRQPARTSRVRPHRR